MFEPGQTFAARESLVPLAKGFIKTATETAYHSLPDDQRTEENARALLIRMIDECLADMRR
ncbi:MAG: hypothetical protein RLZZ127_2878 [Planctomycetota bacterium]|jgi:hypothetical protein